MWSEKNKKNVKPAAYSLWTKKIFGINNAINVNLYLIPVFRTYFLKYIIISKHNNVIFYHAFLCQYEQNSIKYWSCE